MRCIIQRVSMANVSIAGELFSSIGPGLLVFAGFEENDHVEDISWMAGKICSMRIFSDGEGKMNLDIGQMNGEILIVSQFTLHASTKKGNRPSFIRAARPETAIPLYQTFIVEVQKLTGKKVATGQFGADMQIQLLNNGPVTLFIDSRQRE